MDIYNVPFLEDGVFLVCLACLLVLADALGVLASLAPVLQTPTKIDTFLALHSREGSGVLVQCSGTEHLNT